MDVGGGGSAQEQAEGNGCRGWDGSESEKGIDGPVSSSAHVVPATDWGLRPQVGGKGMVWMDEIGRAGGEATDEHQRPVCGWSTDLSIPLAVA